MMNNLSEVARVREHMELECASLKLAMTGYAVVSSHDLINHRYNRIGEHQEALARLIGEEQARTILCETYIQFVK